MSDIARESEDGVAVTGMEALALIQAKHRLSVEIKTGLKFKDGSTLAAVNRLVYRLWPECGLKAFRTKAQAHEWLERVTAELNEQMRGE